MKELLLLAIAFLPSAMSSVGFIGMGTPMYDPVCAYACQAVVSMADIECDESHDHSDMDMGDMGGMSMKKRHGDDGDVTPECRAMSEPYLTSLAYCINSTCSHDLDTWRLEQFWEKEAVGGPGVEPMWTYGQSLMMVNGTPTTTFNMDEPMNETQLVAASDWEEQSRTLGNFAVGEKIHARYA
jgi:hypothetical protein